MSTTAIVTQDARTDKRICLNSASEIDDIRRTMAKHCCFGDYRHLVSDEYEQRLREEFIPRLLAQMDFCDLEALHRLAEGMVIHQAEPWVFEFAKSCFDARLAQASALYHQYNS